MVRAQAVVVAHLADSGGVESREVRIAGFVVTFAGRVVVFSGLGPAVARVHLDIAVPLCNRFLRIRKDAKGAAALTFDAAP